MPTLKSILHVLAAFSYSVMILNVPFGQVSFFVSTTVVEHVFDDFVWAATLRRRKNNNKSLRNFPKSNRLTYKKLVRYAEKRIILNNDKYVNILLRVVLEEKRRFLTASIFDVFILEFIRANFWIFPYFLNNNKQQLAYLHINISIE